MEFDLGVKCTVLAELARESGYSNAEEGSCDFRRQHPLLQQGKPDLSFDSSI